MAGRHPKVPTIEQLVTKRRRANWRWSIMILVLIVILTWMDRQGKLLTRGGDWNRYQDQSFLVTRVVDGDTLDLDAPDGESQTTRVRLWGIDTPELARPSQGTSAEPFAEQARDRARELADGRTVRITVEPSRLRDRYGRLLVFVELPDGSSLNEQLVVEGLAEADDRWQHPKLERFELLEKQARSDRVGMWAEAVESP